MHCRCAVVMMLGMSMLRTDDGGLAIVLLFVLSRYRGDELRTMMIAPIKVILLLMMHYALCKMYRLHY